jgi:hypothetical protein
VHNLRVRGPPGQRARCSKGPETALGQSGRPARFVSGADPHPTEPAGQTRTSGLRRVMQGPPVTHVPRLRLQGPAHDDSGRYLSGSRSPHCSTIVCSKLLIFARDYGKNGLRSCGSSAHAIRGRPLSSPPIDGRRGASVARSNFDRCVDKGNWFANSWLTKPSASSHW